MKEMLSVRNVKNKPPFTKYWEDKTSYIYILDSCEGDSINMFENLLHEGTRLDCARKYFRKQPHHYVGVRLFLKNIKP